MDKLARIDELMNEADKLASEYVIEGARAVLKRCPALDEFICCMGTAFFTVKGSEDRVTVEYDNTIFRNGREYEAPACAYDFLNHVEDLNQNFHVKGMGVRLRANSEVINNWGRVDNPDDLYLTHS